MRMEEKGVYNRKWAGFLSLDLCHRVCNCFNETQAQTTCLALAMTPIAKDNSYADIGIYTFRGLPLRSPYVLKLPYRY